MKPTARRTSLLAASLALGCSAPAPLDPSQIPGYRSGEPLAIAAWSGSQVPIANPLLQPLSLPAGTSGAPSQATIQQILDLTRGSQVKDLPTDDSVKTLQIQTHPDGAALRILDTGNAAEEGMGGLSPGTEATAAFANPQFLANMAIYAARPTGPSSRRLLATVPDSVDLRPQMPPIRDQGPRGTCAIFSTVALLDALYANASAMPIKHASPEFIDWLYQLEVKSQRWPATLWTDDGTYPWALQWVLNANGNAHDPYVPPQQGYLSEEACPYQPYLPSAAADTPKDAESAKIIGAALAASIRSGTTFASQGAAFVGVRNDLDSIKAALAGGQPVQLSLPLYTPDWFDPPRDRGAHIAEITPEKSRQTNRIGYHSMVIVGYETDANAPGGGWFILRNSWGRWWGDNGHCRVSFKYILSYAFDLDLAVAYNQPFQATYGLDVPHPPPSPVPTPVPTTTPAPTATPTVLPSAVPTPFPSTVGPTPIPAPSASLPAPTPLPSATPSPRPTPSPSQAPSPSPLPTPTPGPSATPLPTPTPVPTRVPGRVSTVAGGKAGFADGSGANARFMGPEDLAVDGAGNVFVADHYNDRIRKITPDGQVTTVAQLIQGIHPCGLAVDPAGHIFTTIINNVWELMPDKTFHVYGSSGSFDRPQGLAADAAGNLYVADYGNSQIKKISPSGDVSVVAGQGAGFADGPAAKAKFNYPYGVSVDATGTLYVADTSNAAVRKITPDGTVSTLARIDSNLMGVVADAAGNVYATDGDRVFKTTPAGVTQVFAGGAGTTSSWLGTSLDGIGTAAGFAATWGIAIDAAGILYVADGAGYTSTSEIRKIE